MSNGAVTPGLSGFTALVLTLQSDVNTLAPNCGRNIQKY